MKDTAARLTWTGGGEALVVSLDAKAISLRSTVPSPPGSRLEGRLAGEPPATVRIKVHGCKRQPGGDYQIEGRPIDFTRQVRERIEATFAPRTGRP